GDVHAVRVFIHDDGHDFRRRHGVDDELRRILVVRNDVHALAGDLVGDRLYTRTAHTNTGTHGIDARIVAAHCDLRTHARIACRTENLDQPLSHLRHFELEELDQEFRRRTREEQLRATRLGAHFLQEGLDAVLGFDLLTRNHVGARHKALSVAAEIDIDAVAIDALDHTADELPDAVAIRIDDLRALGLAHFLDDDLLRL